MKIKNLAFFGIMAAILGVNGAARADSTTIIASQAYVDAKDALKQDQDKRIQTSQADYEAISGLTDTKRKEDYPSMYTLKQAIATASSDASNMKDSAASATWDDQDHELDIVTTDNTAGNKTDKVATSNQVQTSISALKSYTDYTKQAKSTANYSMGKSDGTWEAMSQGQQDALNSGIDSDKVAQIATNANDISTNAGNISANASAITALNNALETGLTTAQETAYHNWLDPTMGNRSYDNQYWTTLVAALATDVDNVVSDYQKAHQNLIPRNRNIQKGIAYLKGNGIEHYTPGVKNDGTANVGIQNNTVKAVATKAWNDNLDQHGDEFVPTVASVERRIQAVEATVSAIDQVNNSITDGNTDTAPSEDAVYDALALKQNEADSNVANNGNYISAGHGVAANLVALDTQVKTNADNITTNTTAITTLNGNDTTAGSVAKSIKDAVGALDVSDTADGTPVTAVSEADGKISVTRAVVKYDTALDPKLSNVNASATNDASTAMTNCTLKSPCTLTMIWNNGAPVYEWTNMDTEDTSATL